MHSAKYLYDIDKPDWIHQNYLVVLFQKINLAEQLNERLMEVSPMERDWVRINDVLSAQKFNRKLIEEIKHT